MTSKLARKIQIALGLLMLAAAVRLLFIYQGRREVAKPTTTIVQNSLSLDDYVVPKKLHAYDLRSAKELVGKTVWVKTGNQVAFYTYDPARHRVEFSQEGGLLAPLQQLVVDDVVQQTVSKGLSQAYGTGGKQFRIHQEQQEMFVVFHSDNGKSYAAPVGAKQGTESNIMIDEIFFIQDPHTLYNHWPREIWDAVDRHEVVKGMSELQASFALGAGALHDAGDYGNRTLEFGRGEQRILVTFVKNRATAIVVE